MKILAMLILGFATLLLANSASAQSLDDAHRAFAEGRYHDSTLGYQAVLDHQGYSAPVLFDLGNSYYREGNFAQAILAYKRAEWLSPGDADIEANLQQAEKQAGLPATEPSWMDKIGSILSASEWAWVGSGAWAILCLSILAGKISNQSRKPFATIAWVSALALVAAVAGMVLSSRELAQAVVVDPNASALISPFPQAKPVFNPTSGDTLKVGKSYGDFRLVTDQEGHSGWINKSQIAPIIPSGANG